MAKFQRHLFICINDRGPDHPRGCCAEKGAEEVAAALVGAGFGIRRLEPVRSDLERVFLDLVRGDGGAAGAGRENGP